MLQVHKLFCLRRKNNGSVSRIQQKRSSDIRNSTVANVRSIIRSCDVHDPRGWSLRHVCYHFAHRSTSPKFREENQNLRAMLSIFLTNISMFLLR